jgi:hypothetical protein
MTDRVSIATASAIAAPFYAHLYQHGQPDLALAQSLAGLQGAHDLTVPAIFSRLGDRPLFDDNSERALSEKELEFGLTKLAESLPERAPVLTAHLDTLILRADSTHFDGILSSLSFLQAAPEPTYSGYYDSPHCREAPSTPAVSTQQASGITITEYAIANDTCHPIRHFDGFPTGQHVVANAIKATILVD